MIESQSIERLGATSDAFIARLRDIVGPAGVETSLEQRQFFSLDFSEEPGALALAVVKPKNTEQVAAIVKAASAAGIAVNTRGGGMSYTRGHVPVRPETIIVDATGLNRILEVNVVDRYVTLETGVTWAQLRAALADTGYRVPYLGTLSGNSARASYTRDEAMSPSSSRRRR